METLNTTCCSQKLWTLVRGSSCFPKALYNQIEDLANANNLGFAQTTIMLLTSSIKEPKLVLPKKQDK